MNTKENNVEKDKLEKMAVIQMSKDKVTSVWIGVLI